MPQLLKQLIEDALLALHRCLSAVARAWQQPASMASAAQSHRGVAAAAATPEPAPKSRSPVSGASPGDQQQQEQRPQQQQQKPRQQQQTLYPHGMVSLSR